MAKYKVGDKLGNFEIINTWQLDRISGTMYEMAHTRCGAKLIYIDTPEQNKHFSVTFRTPPENDTGVFHILEHSVLCGSDKYPVREPFVELMKSSLNTFLNAMTFPDKTMYPVSSCNEKDFLNLTSVYLDAVFRPAIYHNPNIFYQEGWHYDLASESDKASFNGVVYSEMKGAESSVDDRVVNEIFRLLYPDTCYKYVSGGATTAIPDLTYDEFIATHKRFYTPNNAIFYLEGDMDPTIPVGMIEEYLGDEADFEPAPPQFAYENKKVVTESRIEYPISPDESDKAKTMVAFAKISCDVDDMVRRRAIGLLSTYITESLESPLTKAIVEGGLGKDVAVTSENDIYQPFLMIQIMNTDPDKVDDIKKTLSALSQKILERGLDREKLESLINNMEFVTNEIVEPQALYHNIAVLGTYLYDKDPSAIFFPKEVFLRLREMLDTDYYDKLLCEMLDLDSMCCVVATPSKTLAAREQEDEEKRAEHERAQWTEAETEAILKQNKALEKWQQTPDTPEQLATIPQLELADINPEPRKFLTKEYECDGAKVLVHPAPIADICYFTVYLPVPNKYEDKLCDITHLVDIFGDVPTENYDVLTLSNEVRRHLGGMSFDLRVMAPYGENDKCTTYLTIDVKVLKSKLDEAPRLIDEVANRSKLNSPDTLANLLSQFFENFRSDVISQGHSIGIKHALAPYSAQGTANEMLDGLTCYEHLKSLCADLDGKLPEFINVLESCVKDTFTRDGMIIGYTVPESDYNDDDFLANYKVANLVNIFPKNGKKEVEMTSKIKAGNNSFTSIPAQVSYANVGTSLDTIGAKFNGAWAVACSIISLAYLWNEVRVQGGAYGVGCRTRNTGEVFFYSYRDPNPCRSYDVYKKCADFLDDFIESGESFDKYIISSISDTEQLLSPNTMGKVADSDHIIGLTYEKRKATRAERLNLTRDELKEVAQGLGKLWQSYDTCLIGGIKDAYKENETFEL